MLACNFEPPGRQGFTGALHGCCAVGGLHSSRPGGLPFVDDLVALADDRKCTWKFPASGNFSGNLEKSWRAPHDLFASECTGEQRSGSEQKSVQTNSLQQGISQGIFENVGVAGCTLSAA
jgi:hypothetical protein